MQSSGTDSPTVLVVGGWSPGPLVYLKSLMTSKGCRVLEPRMLPMPPFPGVWCCHPKIFAMELVLVLLILVLRGLESSLGKVVAGITTLIWIRFLAAVVVSTSIRISGEQCLKLLDEASDRDENIILVGFSWGGAVVADLLAQRKLGEPPTALMIAPTTSLVATLSFTKDAATNVQYSRSVTVVHGTHDTVFCPNQERWEGRGATLHQLQDNHVFFAYPSRRFLLDLVASMLDAARDSQEPM